MAAVRRAIAALLLLPMLAGCASEPEELPSQSVAFANVMPLLEGLEPWTLQAIKLHGNGTWVFAVAHNASAGPLRVEFVVEGEAGQGVARLQSMRPAEEAPAPGFNLSDVPDMADALAVAWRHSWIDEVAARGGRVAAYASRAPDGNATLAVHASGGGQEGDARLGSAVLRFGPTGDIVGQDVLDPFLWEQPAWLASAEGEDTLRVTQPGIVLWGWVNAFPPFVERDIRLEGPNGTVVPLAQGDVRPALPPGEWRLVDPLNVAGVPRTFLNGHLRIDWPEVRLTADGLEEIRPGDPPQGGGTRAS